MKREPVTEARLEAALIQCAHIAAKLPKYRPIYDMVERELLDFRSKESLPRARSLLRNAPAGAYEEQTLRS